MKSDLNDLIQTLKGKPDFGFPVGSNIYKIRFAVTSKRKGKSGGARIITYLVTEHKEIYLVYIYDKSQLENITKEQILELLKSAGLSE